MFKPIVSVTVEVAPPFDALAGTEKVQKEFAVLLSTLGLPARPVVSIGRRPDGVAGPATIWPQLRVNGKRCGYPDDLPLLTYGYVFGVPLRLASEDEIASQFLEPAVGDLMQEWFAMTLVEAVKRQPGILLTADIVAAYAAEIRSAGAPLEDVLKTVLDQRISVADVSTVAQILQEPGSARDVAEKVITALKPDVIEVCLRPDYLRSITIGSGDRAIFKTLTDGMFYETGVRFPRFRFAPAPDMQPNSFCFRVNHLTTPKRCGLAPNQSLVNAPAAGLTHINAQSAINPANGNETSLIDTAHSANLPGDPLVWSPIGYLILALAAELRDKARCFVDVQYTEPQLKTLGAIFPKLTAAASERFSVQDLTRLFRDLASEGVSILDLRSILGAVLDFDYVLADPHYISLDDRLPVSVSRSAPLDRDLVAYVRMQMKRVISHTHNRGGGSLGVHVLSVAFEDGLYRELEAQTSREFVSADALIAELRRQSRNSNPLAAPYPLLTSSEMRPFVRSITSADFPRWPILAYPELASDVKVVLMDTINPK